MDEILKFIFLFENCILIRILPQSNSHVFFLTIIQNWFR